MMATIAELIDQELLKKLQELKARLEKENGGEKEGEPRKDGILRRSPSS